MPPAAQPDDDQDDDRDADHGGDREEWHKRAIWLSRQKTRGASDVYVQNNVWQPGETPSSPRPSGCLSPAE